MKKNFLYLIYIVTVLLGCFVLFVTMFFKNEDIMSEMGQDVQADDGDYASSLDTYLGKNFGFRTDMITMYTALQQGIFKSSAVDDVIIGKNGYLFYEDTVDDYCGLNVLGDREIHNINRTLELMQEYVEKQGGEMLFMVAPNKNSLYDYMPYNYIKHSDAGNWELLKERLTTVNYLDLFAYFGNLDDELYYKTDTHWNDLGAYYVYSHSIDVLDKEQEDWLSSGYTEECSMVGDLQQMLYPNSDNNEKKLVWNKEKEYSFINNVRSVEQAYIETYNENANGSLLMFRDSFANNLIDYYSHTYRYAIYDKASAYNLYSMDIYDADTVILEIAERNLELIKESKPKFDAPVREDIVGKDVEDLIEQLDISVEKISGEEKYFVTGYINSKYADADSMIYMNVDGIVYELTPQEIDGSAYGFSGYILVKEMRNVILIVEKDGMLVQEKRAL